MTCAWPSTELQVSCGRVGEKFDLRVVQTFHDHYHTIGIIVGGGLGLQYNYLIAIIYYCRVYTRTPPCPNGRLTLVVSREFPLRPSVPGDDSVAGISKWPWILECRLECDRRELFPTILYMAYNLILFTACFARTRETRRRRRRLARDVESFVSRLLSPSSPPSPS